MMMTNNEMKNAVREATRMVKDINAVLNKAIASSNDTMYETDRQMLRQVRDENIQTYLKIQDLMMRGLL